MPSFINPRSAMASQNSARHTPRHGISVPPWGGKAAALVLVWVAAAAVVTFAIVRQNSRSEPTHSRATGALLSSTMAGPPSVTLARPPGSVGRPTTLKAVAKAQSGRIVAVTFTLDGSPLGSDTTAPYRLLLDPELVSPGQHRLQATAVDSLGRRRTSGAVALKTRRYANALVASPERGLARALSALRQGHVTVRLTRGRYRLSDVTVGDGARLVGSGPGTVIAAPPGPYFAILVARGRDVTISDLSVDG